MAIDHGTVPTVSSTSAEPASIPAGMKKTCTPNPNTGAEAPACPVLNYLGLTFWAFSYNDNRVSFGIVAYDSSGKPLKQWEKPGARYVYRITVDPNERTVTFRGQSDAAVSMSWGELASAVPAATSTPTVQAMPGTVSPAEVARKLAPNVHLHSQDIHRPSSIPWFLARTTLMSGTSSLGTLDGISRITTPPGLTPVLVSPTPDGLAAYSSSSRFGGQYERGDIGLWPNVAAAGGSASWSILDTSRFSDYAQETLRGEPIVNNACHSEVYFRITKPGAGRYQITYYFFYPYNGGLGPTSSWESVPLGLHSGFYAHVGDWERVTASVTIDRNLISLQNVVFEYHGSPATETEGNLSFSNRTLDQITPIEVYSAWHSHASYKKSGQFSLDSMSFGPLTISWDYTDNWGPIWRTADHLVEVRDDSPNWIKYNGYFGADVTVTFTGVKVLKNGPEGPAFHGQWLDAPQWYPFSTGPVTPPILQ